MPTSLTILHGDNIVASRVVLQNLLACMRAEQREVRRFEAKTLTPAMLHDALGSQELFSAQACVVIEELFSLPKSARKDELLRSIEHTIQPVVIWEKKTLTPTQLKQFSHATVQQFKTSSAMFVWLDLLGSSDISKVFDAFHKAVESDGVELCFAMLIRQIRLLLQIKTGVAVKLAPFVLTKLHKQASFFTEERLLNLHHRLLVADERQKTSGSSLGLQGEIEMMISI